MLFVLFLLCTTIDELEGNMAWMHILWHCVWGTYDTLLLLLYYQSIPLFDYCSL
jgi:hypothetical protein